MLKISEARYKYIGILNIRIYDGDTNLCGRLSLKTDVDQI